MFFIFVDYEHTAHNFIPEILIVNFGFRLLMLILYFVISVVSHSMLLLWLRFLIELVSFSQCISFRYSIGYRLCFYGVFADSQAELLLWTQMLRCLVQKWLSHGFFGDWPAVVWLDRFRPDLETEGLGSDATLDPHSEGSDPHPLASRGVWGFSPIPRF